MVVRQHMTENIISNHFVKLDLDIRKKSPGYSRFMDQKVTPDVLRFVAECIIQYTENKPGFLFTASEIEHSDYFVKNVQREFNKPPPDDIRTKHEYDKWSSQIIQTLRFAGVLVERGKKGRANGFIVVKPELLTYVAERSQNAYDFIFQYLIKLLKDSGFYSHIEKYRDKYLAGRLDKTDFQELKEWFERFIIGHTRIKKKYEPRRILPKVINILAAEYRIPGVIHGRMSKFPFMTSDLIYNRVNFRDIEKSKGISRQEYMEREELVKRGNPIHRIANAKRRIKELHSGSEVNDQWAIGEATQVHHIFPDNEFPQIADRLENLIRLTPTQHNTKAHPHNRTAVIDREYQYVCLIEKSYSIEKSLNTGEFDYSRESFIGVINVGLGQSFLYDLSFEDIRTALKKVYSS